MTSRIILSLLVIVGLACSSSAYAQGVAGEQRIVEPIIVNGQHVQGALVIQNGAVQTYTCAAPQSYVTENQSESGWACFDQTTGMWLLHAQAPAQAATSSQPPVVVYTQPSPEYVVTSTYPYYSSYGYPYGYYPYSYPYNYYPYPYPYFVGPRFGFGFGFGFGHRSPVIVNRPFVGRSFAPVVRHGFVGGGFRGPSMGGFRGPGMGGGFRGAGPRVAGGGMGFGRMGRR